MPLIYNETVKGLHSWLRQQATWCLSWVTSVLLCPDVYEERPLRVADPKVVDGSWYAKQNIVVSWKRGLWPFQHHSQKLSNTRTAQAVPILMDSHLSSEGSPWITGGSSKATSSGMLPPQGDFWEYLQKLPGLPRSALVANEAFSPHASLYLNGSEVTAATSSSLHTGHPRPGLSPPTRPISGSMVLRCVWEVHGEDEHRKVLDMLRLCILRRLHGSQDKIEGRSDETYWRLACGGNTAHLHAPRGLTKVGASKQS